ncbi:MAG: hypothetical protein HY011_23585 [Acidobacteria bacterium]|nr:hypothetical protein [Acidobacteriota bacterium]
MAPKAKLIKRPEQHTEGASTSPASHPHSTNVTSTPLAVTRGWVQQRQAVQPPNPRVAFAALFTPSITTN